jgi:hypothetical protein
MNPLRTAVSEFPPGLAPRHRNLLPRTQWFIVLSLALLSLCFSGCAALQRARLRDTEAFYRSSTTQTFSSKPEKTPIPVFSKAPPGSSVIGRFQFSTLRGSAFAMEAAKHNARVVGADALVVHDLRDWVQPYRYYQPPDWVFIPRTRLGMAPAWRPGPGGGPGRWQTFRSMDTFSQWEWRPGYWVSGSHTHSIIDAEMLRWKN